MPIDLRGVDLSIYGGAPRRPPEPPPSAASGFLARSGEILGAFGRAGDWVLGTAAEHPIASWLVPGMQPVAALTRLADLSPEEGAALKAGQTTFGKELAEQAVREEGAPVGLSDFTPIGLSSMAGGKEGLEHGRAAQRAVVEFAGDMARDPLSYGVLGALKAAGLAGRALDVGLSAAFALQAGSSVPAEYQEAKRLYAEDGGWSPRVTEAVAKGTLGAGGAFLGAKHALGEGARFVRDVAPREGGRVYEADPNATPYELRALEASRAAQEQAANARAGQDVAALGTAMERLRQEAPAPGEAPLPEAFPTVVQFPEGQSPYAWPHPESVPVPVGAPPRGGELGPLTPESSRTAFQLQGGLDRVAYEMLRAREEAARAREAEPVPQGERPEAPTSEAPSVERGDPQAYPPAPWRETSAPGYAREYAIEARPWEQLRAERDRLAQKLEAGTLTDGEAQMFLRIDQTLRDAAPSKTATEGPSETGVTTTTTEVGPNRLSRQVAEAQVRAMAAVNRQARELTGTLTPEESAVKVGPLQMKPRLSTDEASRLAEDAAAALAPASRPRLGQASPGVRFSQRASEVAREQGASGEAIPESRTPEGYRKLAEAEAAKRGARPNETLWSADKSAPEVIRATKRRLLELWGEEKAKVEQARVQAQGGAVREVAPQTMLQKATRAMARWVEPAFEAAERLPGVGKEFAGRARAFVNSWERRAGEEQAASYRALASLPGGPDGPMGRAVWEALDNAKDGVVDLASLPPEARPVAQALAQISEAQRQAASAAGMKLGPRELMPHYPTPEKAAKFTLEAEAADLSAEKGITVEQARAELARDPIKTLAGRRAVSEHARAQGAAALQPGEYRTDWGVWFDRSREMSRRIAEYEHLGPSGEKTQALINRLPRGLDRDFAQTFVNRLREVETRGRGDATSSLVRSGQSVIGLVASPISQSTTLWNTVAEAGLRPTAKALLDTFGREVAGPDGKPMRWSHPIKRMRAAMKESRLDAMRQGALWSSNAEGIIGYFLNHRAAGGEGIAGNFAKKSGNLWHLKATGWMDGLQRTIAAGTAKHVVPEAWAAAKRGDRLAQRQLDNWHVDWRRKELTPEMVDTAAKRISDRSQFHVGTGDLPLWASSPWGKVAFQFQSFGYAHARFVGSALAEANRGNYRPVASLLTIGAAMGYLSNNAKRLIFSGRSPEDPTEEDFAKAAEAVFKKGAHYEVKGEKGAALAYIEGLAAAGGLGALGTLVERVPFEGKPGQLGPLLFGATGADLEALSAMKLGDKASMGRAASGILPVGPLGLNPREWVRELTADKPSERPGYAGKILDTLQGKEGASVLGPPSQERQDIGRIRRAGEQEREAAQQFNAIVPPKAQKPVDERAEAAERRAALKRAYVEIARAMKRDDWDAAAQAASDARMTREQYRRIVKRIAYGLPPEE